MNPLWIAVHLPDLSLQAATRGLLPQLPVVITETSGNRTLIAARAEPPGWTSRAAGIRANSANPGRLLGACSSSVAPSAEEDADRTPPIRAAASAAAPRPFTNRISLGCPGDLFCYETQRDHRVLV